jgi:hypothetical protein
MSRSPIFGFHRIRDTGNLQNDYATARSFSIDMHNFFHTRMDHVRPEKQGKEYARDIEEYCRLYDELKTMLPTPGQKRLFDLDAVIGKIEADQQDLMYQSGFTDGVRFIINSLSGKAH